MPMSWNAEADAKMFAAILKTSDKISFDNNAIAQLMGPDCTAKAVSHRIANLKKLAANMTPATSPLTTNGKGPATPRTPKTPKKRAADDDGEATPSGAVKKPRSAAKGKGKGMEDEVKSEEVENGEDVIMVKDEDEDDDGDDEPSKNGHAAPTVEDNDHED